MLCFKRACSNMFKTRTAHCSRPTVRSNVLNPQNEAFSAGAPVFLSRLPKLVFGFSGVVMQKIWSLWEYLGCCGEGQLVLKPPAAITAVSNYVGRKTEKANGAFPYEVSLRYTTLRHRRRSRVSGGRAAGSFFPASNPFCWCHMTYG